MLFLPSVILRNQKLSTRKYGLNNGRGDNDDRRSLREYQEKVIIAHLLMRVDAIGQLWDRANVRYC